MTDEDIVIMVQCGDVEAYSLLVDRYKEKVFRLIYRYTNDYMETQDLAQEIFIKMYRQISTFRFQSKVATWCYRIVRNSCIDWDRKRKKEKNVIFLKDEEMVIDEKNNPEEKLLFEEKKEGMLKIINKLSPKYKLVIIMYHFHNLKYKEIGEILDIPIKTVETRLYRARSMIKKEMENLYKGGEGLWNVVR